MEKTKESKVKKEKKEKKKEKATIGDIIFRVLILVAIFFTVVIMYVYYIRNSSNTKGITTENLNSTQVILNI